ncbi:hypothetical protein Kosp01_00140 [Kocuria sp. NBRC 114282]|nr:hypothetical protein Kosp01_00140 [Kocuria sp. NBRC 114282]
MDWFAPCPWCGTVAWAASPSRVIRPSDQCVSGGRKNSAHRAVTGTAVTISTTGASPSAQCRTAASPESSICVTCLDRCRDSGSRAPNRMACRSARWMPRNEAPKRLRYSSCDDSRAIRAPVRPSRKISPSTSAETAPRGSARPKRWS